MRMLASALIALQLAAFGAMAETVERRAPADPRGEVEIVNVAGEVRVSGWSKNEVEVIGDLGRNVERLEFVSEGKRTRIKVVLPPGRRNASASDLRVRIPAQSSLAVNTVSADQIVEGVRGRQQLQAVSGDVTTEVFGAEFELQTVSGDVVVRGQGGTGGARVSTVSGDVQLSKIGPQLDINTVNGDMDVRMDTIERARIKSTNGSLNLTGDLKPNGRIDAEAVNGDMTLLLRPPVNAEFDIETFNGAIQNCFGAEPRRSREFGPGNELRFREGKGEAQVRIKTLNGTVEVCKK